MASENKGRVERGHTSIIAIISIIIALLSVSFTAGQMLITHQHNRFDETYDSVAMLSDRLTTHWEWVNSLPGDVREKALPYYREASNKFEQAEDELRQRNYDLARQRIGEAYVSLQKAKEAVE